MKPLHPPRFLPLILAAAACVLAALCLWQVLQLKSQLKDTTLSQAEQLSAMDAALQSLPHQMEDALHPQASLLANYDWHYGDLNPETGTLPVTFTAVPKEQTASVTTATLVCNGKSYPMEAQDTGSFTVTVEVPLLQSLAFQQVILAEGPQQRIEALDLQEAAGTEELLHPWITLDTTASLENDQLVYEDGSLSIAQMTPGQVQSVTMVAAVEGNFDDAQSAVKRIFGDRALAERLAGNSHVVLSSANSINVGRLVPQVVYYFSAYAQLLADQVINVGDEVEFVVPTGNFGDILAGYYAKLLGLPVKHLVVASDKNNVLFDFLTTGTYNRQRPFFQTISPSMDILISSNLERMLYYLSEGDTRLISMLMNDLNKWGTYEIPEELLAKIRQIFGTGWADEDQVRESIKHCWDENHYVIDPHTACGYYLLEQMPRDPLTPRVLLSTASPYKFPRVVNEALGFDATGTDFECMDVLAHETGTTAPAALRGLETADVRFKDVVAIDGMEDYVEKAAQAL